MKFEAILWNAQEGDPEAILQLLGLYRPLLVKKSVLEGKFDEDLYQELVFVFLKCVRKFQVSV